MTCIKTGAQAYISQHNQYVWCDIHQFGATIVLRISNESRSSQPYQSKNDVSIMRIGSWWDKDRSSAVYSTLVAERAIVHFSLDRTER